MADTDTPKPYHEPTIPFAEQRSALRAQIGQAVGDSLDHSPGVLRVGASRERPVQMYIFENFLSRDECRALAEQIDAGCYPSPLYEKEKYAEIRTSESCNLNAYNPLIQAIDVRLANLLGIDRSWGEPMQGQKYSVGQEFRDHADFFYIDQPYWAEYEPHGGQRTWTAMAYLVTPQAGGGTSFPLLNIDVAPLTGRLIIWNNMALDGSPNPWTLHCGRPVEEGVKYIFTKWYRERPFT